MEQKPGRYQATPDGLESPRGSSVTWVCLGMQQGGHAELLVETTTAEDLGHR